MAQVCRQGHFQMRDRGNRFAAQHRRGALYRLNLAHVTGAAAQDGVQRLADLGLGWVSVFLQERLGGQDLRRGAETALNGARLDKGLLDRVQFLVLAYPFQGYDLCPSHSRGFNLATADWFPIQEHGANAAVAIPAAIFDAEVRRAAKRDQESFIRSNRKRSADIINGDGNFHTGSVHELFLSVCMPDYESFRG